MYRLTLSVAAFFVLTVSFGQQTRGEKQAQANELSKNRAVVERFDQSAIQTKEQREKERIANAEKRFQILSYLDTVTIAEGTRKKLRRDLDENPFSARFQKFLVRYKKEVIVNTNKTTLVQQK